MPIFLEDTLLRHRLTVLAAVVAAGVMGFASPANASSTAGQPHHPNHHGHHAHHGPIQGDPNDMGASMGMGTSQSWGHTSADAHDVTFRADMTADKVLNGAGDAGAGGYAVIDLKPDNTMCYVLWTHDIDGQITMAHIHLGNNTKNGPIFVTLSTPSFGSVDTCQHVTTRVASALNEEPTNFYVNVHSSTYPNGAIRGQLHRG